MSFRVFIKQCIMRFFIITTCVTAAMALMGEYFMPEATFGFYAFYSPLISGVLGSLPSFVLYSKKELNLKQTIIRQFINFILLIAILTTAAWFNNNISNVGETILFIFMVSAIYIVVHLISLWAGSKEAKQINEGLSRLQNRE